MQTVITYYKNLTRWDVKNFSAQNLFGDNFVLLGSLIKRYQKSITPKQKQVSLVTLSNTGQAKLRKEVDINEIKGKLFSAEPGMLIYSKIAFADGSIGILPKLNNIALSSEFPVYEVDENRVNKIYLWLYLTSENTKKQSRVLQVGQGRKRVYPKDFENIRIYLPSLKIQEKIVSDWSKAQKEAQELNKKVDEREKVIDDYILRDLGIEKKEYEKKKGVFVAWFKDLERWDVQYFSGGINLVSKNFVPLKTAIARFENGKIIPRKNVVYKYVGLEHIEKNNGNYNFEEVNGEEIKSQSIVLKNGCVYYAKLRPYLNKVFLFEKKEDNFISTSELYGFSVKDEVDKKYLLFLLLSELIQSQIKDLMIGARMPRISEDNFKNLKIVLPPLPKQKEIAKKVEAVRAEIAEIKSRASGILETTQKEIGAMLKK